MKIERVRKIVGPNVYSHKPVILIRLLLSERDFDIAELQMIYDRLIIMIPELAVKKIGHLWGRFSRNQIDARAIPQLVAAVALALTERLDYPATNATALKTENSQYSNIVIEYQTAPATEYLLQTAVELVDAIIVNQPFKLSQRIIKACEIVADTELDSSTRAIVDAARQSNIPISHLNNERLIQLGYGKNSRLINASTADSTSMIAAELTEDKQLTKTMLERAFLPVPAGRIAQTPEDALAVWQEIGGPVVIKPRSGERGLGVSINLNTDEQVLTAFNIAQSCCKDVIVEEFLQGRDYRILMINYRVVAASERVPTHVVGDGIHSIAELIFIANQDSRRGDGHARPWTHIQIDESMMVFLDNRGIKFNDIPAKDEIVILRKESNLSTGSESCDVTDQIHPEIMKICQRTARVARLDICSLDLITADISQPLQKGSGFIEIDTMPDLRMHSHPGIGKPRDVGKAIINMIYPDGADARIPIISITGTNGKTTVTRLIGHLIAANHKVGITTTDGIWIDGNCITLGDTTGPTSARVVLADSTVEVAVLETARGGIVRTGLGYDWSDISVMINIQSDHIGQDGIKTLEDILFIKSLIAERVRPGGKLILNADDPLLARLAASPRINDVEREIIYFSRKPDQELIRTHLAEGRTAYLLKDNWIIEARGDQESRIVEPANLPITMNGLAAYQIINLCAAIAAARAYGLSIDQITNRLNKFQAETHNPGRGNLYQVKNGYVLIDYGHNTDAFHAISQMALQWQDRRVTGIIGVPGDRDNSIIYEAARAVASGFNRIIVREDSDLRGRDAGVVPEMICDALKANAPDYDCRYIADQIEALTLALNELQDGEVVILFYDDLASVLALLEKYNATPVTNLEAIIPAQLKAKIRGA